MRIAIIGLGYVGLPLALEFAKKYQVVGFDINLIKDVNNADYDAVIFAVSHDNFLSDKFQDLVTDKRIIFDLKNMLDSPYVDGCL